MTGAYTDLVNNAQNVASQPLQLYNGPLVAGLTDQQNQAVSGIGAAANSGAPGFAQAQQFINQSATPITPQAYSADAINQYMSPYTQNVVDATQNQFNLQNAQQQSGLRGSAASAGALGGDREAILQAQLAGQQTSAQAPVIAGLYNQGFNQAQGEFNTQQGVGLSAAQANNASAANAGYATGANTSAAQNSALAGNQAYLTAAGLQQGVNQANLNVPYEQYLQTQAYPYQNLDFLSSILGGASQGSGTTTTGTQTKPINWAGLLMQGAGAVAGAKNGGRIGLAAGGIPDVSTGYVPPPMQMQPGRAVSPQVQSQDSSPQETANGGLSIHDLLSGAKNVGDWLGGSGTSEAGKGMGALGLLGFGHGGRTRLADGGIDDPDGYIRDVLAGLQPSDQSPSPPHPTPSSDQPPSAVPAASQQGLAAAAPAGATMLSAADTPPDWRGQATNFAPPPDTPSGLAAAGTPPSDNPTWDDGTPVTGGGSGLAAASAPAGQRTIWQAPEPDVWHSVLAGLGGFLSHGLGAGISTGLKDYDDQMDPHPVVDHSGSTIMVQYGGPGKRGQIIDTGIPTEAALTARASHDDRAASLAAMQDWHKGELDDKTASRAQAAAQAAAALQEKEDHDKQGALDRWNTMNVARVNAGLDPLPMPAELASSTPSAAPSPGTGSAAGQNLTNNNPGNIRIPGKTNFQSFPTMQAGIDAVGNQLGLYQKRGINTIAGMVSTYAPKTDGNDTEKYIANVSRLTGLDPNKPVDSEDIPKIRDAMITTEQGGVSPAQLLASPKPAPGTPAGDAAALAGNVDDTARAIAHYQIAPLSGYAMARPRGQRIMARVLALNPDYAAGQFPERNRGMIAFGSGPQGDQVRFFNTSLGHMGTLANLAGALGNGDIRVLNDAKQKFSAAFGQAAPTNFDAAKQIVGQEIVKAIVGKGGGVDERRSAAEQVARANSPEQLQGVINNVWKPLAIEQLRGLRRQYETTTHMKDFYDKLSPEAVQMLGMPAGSIYHDHVYLGGPMNKATSWKAVGT